MGTCLVTTLKENVVDDKLLKLGEIRGYIKKSNTILKVCIFNNPEIHIKVTPPCYFTDSSGTSNLGTQTTVNAGSSNALVYISSKNGDGFITFDNKYGILDFEFLSTNGVLPVSTCEISLEDLAGMSLTKFSIGRLGAVGNVSAINNFTAWELTINSDEQGAPKLTGNVSDIKTFDGRLISLRKCTNLTGNVNAFGDRSRFPSLKVLNLGYDSNLTGELSAFTGKNFEFLSFSKTQIAGDVSMLTGNSNLHSLYIENTKVTGTLSSIASLLPRMSALTVSGTSISGDTSDLAPLTNLTVFIYKNCPNITGTWPLA